MCGLLAVSLLAVWYIGSFIDPIQGTVCWETFARFLIRSIGTFSVYSSNLILPILIPHIKRALMMLLRMYTPAAHTAFYSKCVHYNSLTISVHWS